MKAKTSIRNFRFDSTKKINGRYKSLICSSCGSKLNVSKYLEDNCAFFYKLCCDDCNRESASIVIQVPSSLRPGKVCPNCLIGRLWHAPIKDSSIRLVCDSCLRAIHFGYSIEGETIQALGVTA